MKGGMETTEIRGITKDSTLRTRITKALAMARVKLTVRPVRGQVVFVDDNGPKGGPALRCTITLRVPYRPSVRVERRAETPRLAFDGALAVLERQIERYRERERDNKRHPKKYFAARRAEGVERVAPAPHGRRAGGAKD